VVASGSRLNLGLRSIFNSMYVLFAKFTFFASRYFGHDAFMYHT